MPALILVVDDNAMNLKLASRVLEAYGFRVTCVGSGEEALQSIERELPDLVLMDIALPGIDGLTLTRQLKADARYQGMKIVALTASAMKGDDVKAYAAGCDGYIPKPIDTRTFASQVAHFLQADS